jgi:YD repeat-containing protein
VPIFFYANVEIRKSGTTSARTQLVKEYYDYGVNGYTNTTPLLTKRIHFRGNNLSDTLKIEEFSFGTNSIDTVAMDWLKPGTSYLPGQIYYLDGQEYDNTNQCTVLYNGVGRYGIITPRQDLLLYTSTKDFDQNTSTVTLTNKVTKTYNNNWQLLTENSITSKGTIDSIRYNYLYTNAGSFSNTVKTDNLYALVDKTTRLNGTQQLENTRVHFSQINGLVLPDSFFVQKLSNAEIYDKMITAYDTSGHIIEVDSKRRLYSSFIRNYNNQLVTASVAGARVSQIAYSSFEAENKGNWSYSGAPATDATSPTGTQYYNLSNGSVTKSSLSSSTTYIVSYWLKTGSISISGSGAAKQGKTIDGWTYYETEVTGVTSVTVSGTASIDELRLYPKGALMITYCYLPLIGLTAECDAANRITYYEYDSFGRLKLIRDQDKKILKSYDYQYKVSQQQ